MSFFGGKMGTRGMIAVQRSEYSYNLFYKHLDAYPEWLGVELMRKMVTSIGDDIENVMEAVGAKREANTVEKPEDAFLRIQGDLEWIYAIEGLDDGKITEKTSLIIYRTSNPWCRRKFVFRVWSSYLRLAPVELGPLREIVDMILMAISAYDEA